MILLTNWLSPNILRSLGWALLHFLWQGTALAALAAAGMTLCRRASARYALAVSVLVLMFVAPVATFFLYSPVRAESAPSAVAVRTAWAPTVAAKITGMVHATASSSSASDAFPWLVGAWLVGVALLSLRSAGGFLLLERERRRQSTTVDARLLEVCETLQRRLKLDRVIRYCECKWLQAPAVIGWFRPIVLLPVTALTGLSEQQLQSVIAHELAHIQRFDAFVNVFQLGVETLLFYHPAVWWLSHRIREEREHCCDDVAVSLCGNVVEYARALTLMEEWRSAPVLAMAANRGPLAARIFRLLGMKSAGGTRGIGVTGSILCLTGALLAGNAFLGIAYPHPTVYANQISFRQFARAAALQSAHSQPTPASQPTPRSVPTPPSKPTPVVAPAREEQPAPATSYIEGLKSAGLTDLTVNQLVALKIQDVTPVYIRELQAAGLHPDADGFIALRVQGVTPAYIQELHGLGLAPDEQQVVALKVQGVSPEYVSGLQQAGIKSDVNELIALKIQGVTPQYILDLRNAGLTVDAQNVIAMKIQGVTAQYVRGLQAQGVQPDVDDVVAMRIQSVTPEYVRDIRALGLKPSDNQIIAMRIQDVTQEYIKALQSAGFKVDVDDIISAKVQGITPEFLEQARKHGFKDLTLRNLIELKHLGLLEPKADI
jgi:beta-lactamase regulating signal transducer with metallopeptidase domain